MPDSRIGRTEFDTAPRLHIQAPAHRAKTLTHDHLHTQSPAGPWGARPRATRHHLTAFGLVTYRRFVTTASQPWVVIRRRSRPAGGGTQGGPMRIPLPAAVPMTVLILLPAALSAQAQPPGQTKETEAEFIKAAEAGAPDRISAQATIVRMEPKGQTAMVRQGSNGFTCFLMPDEIHTPVCTD